MKINHFDNPFGGDGKTASNFGDDTPQADEKALISTIRKWAWGGVAYTSLFVLAGVVDFQAPGDVLFLIFTAVALAYPTYRVFRFQGFFSALVLFGVAAIEAAGCAHAVSVGEPGYTPGQVLFNGAFAFALSKLIIPSWKLRKLRNS